MSSRGPTSSYWGGDRRRRFRLKAGELVKTQLDFSEVTIAVIEVVRAQAKLIEVVTAGENAGRAWDVIFNSLSGETGVYRRDDYAGALLEARRAAVALRYLRYDVQIFDGPSIEVREFCPPFEHHRYALVASSPPGAVLELPGWIGEEVTADLQTDAYRIIVEEFRKAQPYRERRPQ